MPEGRGQRSPLDQLLANMIGEPIEGIQPGLFIPHGARAYHRGTSAPIIGMPMLHLGGGGLDIPPHSIPSPSDYMGVYLTLREYGPDLAGLGANESEAIRLFARQLIGNVGRENMIHHLCGLVMAISRPEMAAQLRMGLEASITPASRARLRRHSTPSPAITYWRSSPS